MKQGVDDPRMIDTRPPAAVARNARRGLALREKFNRGGTHVGVARARQLAARAPLEEREIVAISSYFARHAVDKTSKSHVWADESRPSAGYIAWLLWGGDAGRDWVDALKAQLRG